MVSMQECICEGVTNWVATIKRVLNDVGPYLTSNGLSGAVFLVMGREDLKGIGVAKVWLLGLRLKETTKLFREKKYKSVFVDHNT